MIETATQPDLIAVVKQSPEDMRAYLACIRRKMNAAASERERAGYAIIALAIEAELKERK